MMLGLGGDSDVSYADWLDYGGDPIPDPGSTLTWDFGGGYLGSPMTVAPRPAGANYSGLFRDIIRGGFALTAEQTKKPLYQTQTTPSGSMTTVYGSGTGLNYPGGQGPTKVPVAGISTTTMLLLGAAAMMLMVVMSKR